MPGSIYLDGKNVLGLVVELDCERFLGGAELVAVVAETRTRGSLSVRIERVGRPEIKNLMLGPKQFDQVNRDLEIRDLYNMEDAFELGESLPGRVPRAAERQPRLLGRPGRQRWTGRSDGDGAHPLTELLLADYLVVDATKPYVEQGSFLETGAGRAPRRASTRRAAAGRSTTTSWTASSRCVVNAGNGPTIRDGVDASTRPSSRAFPYLAAPNPDPPKPPPPHSH